MGRKIPNTTIKGIIDLLNADLLDKEISERFDVSSSYVNKVRNRYKNKPEQYDYLFEDDKEVKETKSKNIKVIEPTGTLELDEIELLKLKINSLEQTLKWYKELLKYKTKK